MLVDTIEIIRGSGNSIGGIPREKTLTMPGELVVVTGPAKWYIPTNISITSVVVRTETAPTGSSIRLSLKKNGVQLTTTTIDIPEDQYSVTVSDEALLDSSGVPGDYYTVDVVQTGAITKGSDLTVQLNYVTVIS